MKTALLILISAFLLCACEETYVEHRPAVVTTRHHSVRYVEGQPYYNVYYDYGRRPYYRRYYYEDEPAYRVEGRRYYYRPGSVRVTTY